MCDSDLGQRLQDLCRYTKYFTFNYIKINIYSLKRKLR